MDKREVFFAFSCSCRDGVPDQIDNCPRTSNPNQGDIDKDGKGDECDNDKDGDNIINANDNCELVYNPGQEDRDGNLSTTRSKFMS